MNIVPRIKVPRHDRHSHAPQTVNYRVSIEKNKGLQRAGVDEYGHKGAPQPRFMNNKDCKNAYRAYLCWTNFPRCDADTAETLMTCRSACENLVS